MLATLKPADAIPAGNLGASVLPRLLRGENCRLLPLLRYYHYDTTITRNITAIVVATMIISTVTNTVINVIIVVVVI